jgi:D-alanine transaminase
MPSRHGSSDVGGACEVAWLDGSFLPLAQARISPLDRGFLFADAVYEVLPVYAGRVYRLQQHLERLERSLREIRIDPVLSRDAWRRICGGLISRNGGGDLLIYLQVSRGAEAERRHVPAGAPRPTVFGMASRLAPLPADPLERGTRCVTAADIRWARCDIKSTALLANLLLKWHAEERGASEAILLSDGWLTEGATSSVHVMRDGVLVTPPQTSAVLPGTTRHVLLEIAPRSGVRTSIEPVSETQLRGAAEILLASAGGGLRAVTSLDGQPVGDGQPGPVFCSLYRTWLDTRAEFSTECTE